MPALTVFQACSLAVALRFLIRYIPLAYSAYIPSFLTAHRYPPCLFLALTIYVLDHTIFWPYFRTPLRAFPMVPAKNIMAERPRGKTVLAWFSQHPNADVVVMRSLTGECQLFPCSPDALRDITCTHAYHWAKPWGIRAFLGRVIGFGLVVSEGDAHRKQRKTLTPAFNIKNIKALYPLMRDKVGVLIEQLSKEIEGEGKSGIVEISGWASRLTLDIIGPAALSRDFQTLTSEHDPVAEAFGELLDPSPELVTFLVANVLLPQWFATRLPVRANRLIKEHCTRLRVMCRGILDEKQDRLKQIEEGKGGGREEDILQNIIASGQFTDDEVIDQMLTFLAAGHETTASALTWCMYLLAQDLDVQRRLREEIRSHVSFAVTPAVLEGLPLLNGVCEETLRLFPTIPLTIREAQCDTTVAGVDVPKGTHALIVPYAINRHPHSWGGSSAEEFSPERWIETTPEGSRPNKHGGAFSNFCETTFLHGPRSCIGRDFAKAELRCAVAGLIGRFEMELAEPNAEVVIGGTVTTRPVGGLRLRVRLVPGWDA